MSAEINFDERVLIRRCPCPDLWGRRERDFALSPTPQHSDSLERKSFLMKLRQLDSRKFNGPQLVLFEEINVDLDRSFHRSRETANYQKLNSIISAAVVDKICCNIHFYARVISIKPLNLQISVAFRSVDHFYDPWNFTRTLF